MTVEFKLTKFVNYRLIQVIGGFANHSTVFGTCKTATNDFIFTFAGAINSEFARNTSSLLQLVLTPMTSFFFKNTVQGAQTTLHCALQEGLEPLNGRYFSNCTPRSLFAKAKDDVASKKLWELSERLSGLA